MGKNIKWRTIENFKNKKWLSTKFELLKKGDIFRMFEDDKMPVKDKNNRTTFIATSNPIPCSPTGNFSIETIIKGELNYVR